MKITPDDEHLPPSREAGFDASRPESAERRLAFSFAEHVLANWGRTARAIAVTVAVLGLALLALWLLPIDLKLGPVLVSTR